jgi:hypothetical protein
MSTPNAKHGYTPDNCPSNRTGTGVHRCLLCISPYEPEPVYDIRQARYLGQFVLELGEMVKLRLCTAREFSRAVNVARWTPQTFDHCPNTSGACDLALELIRANPKRGNYE